MLKGIQYLHFYPVMQPTYTQVSKSQICELFKFYYLVGPKISVLF